MTINHVNPLRPSETLQGLMRSPGRRVRSLLATAMVALMAGACSADLSTLGGEEPAANMLTANAGDAAKMSKSDLDKAIEYWGAEHKKKPTDLKAGLSYARNLKAAGQKEQAFGVMQSLALLHGDSKELASEYGRLALDLGQVQVAQQLLAMADDPMKPDWRVISAMGTVQAKQGKYAEAVPYYERALQLSPEQPSVLNNLAMAHAAAGEPGKAEEILRRLPAGDPKIQQNLALVLGLQSKHEDAQKVSSASALPPGAATANTEYVRSMVKPAPQPEADVVPAAPARVAAAPKKPKSTEKAKTPQMRDSAGPAEVAGSVGGWDTSIAQAD